MTPRREFTKEQLNSIVEFYKTHSFKETASYVKASTHTLKRVFEENEIPIRNASEAHEFGVKKHQETCIKRYGVKNPFQSEEIKQKIKDTCLQKYGVEYSIQSAEVKRKIVETNKKRYGKEYFNNTEKRRQTCLEKYGTPSASGNADVKKKVQQTCLDRYGVDNVFKSEEVKKKISKIQEERYGGVGFASLLKCFQF